MATAISSSKLAYLNTNALFLTSSKTAYIESAPSIIGKGGWGSSGWGSTAYGSGEGFKHVYTLVSSKTAYVSGPFSLTISKPAYLQVALNLSSSLSAYMFGVYLVKPSKLAFIDGELALTVNKKLYIVGTYLGIDIGRNVYISGFTSGTSQISSKSAYVQNVINNLTTSHLLFIYSQGELDAWPLNDGLLDLTLTTLTTAYDQNNIDNGTYYNGVTPTDGPQNF